MKKTNNQKEYHVLYKITNLLNDMIYVGAHTTKYIHRSYWGSSTYLKKDIRKYGRENFQFEILALADSIDELIGLEKSIVNDEWVKSPHTYNRRRGGIGPKVLSEETKEKIKRYRTGRKWDESTKERIGEGGKFAWTKWPRRKIKINHDNDNESEAQSI